MNASIVLFAFLSFVCGACMEFEVCSPSYAPVCATNGVTYDNVCKLKQAQCIDSSITLHANGPCEFKSKACPTTCDLKFDPQCGSNGLTYANLCELEKAHCKNSMVTLAHAGRCERSSKCPRICTADYSPVCASNGHTYSNRCRFDVARCNQGTSSTLHIVHYGHCRESNGSNHLTEVLQTCPEACEDKYSPLCASNGKTYSNQCYFEMESCRNNSIVIAHHGECSSHEISCTRPCTREYSPICASNGITYANPCLFRIANCYANGELFIVSYGPC